MSPEPRLCIGQGFANLLIATQFLGRNAYRSPLPCTGLRRR